MMSEFYIGWDDKEMKRGIIYRNNLPFANFYKLGEGWGEISGKFAFNRALGAIEIGYYLSRYFDTVEEMIETIAKDLNRHD